MADPTFDENSNKPQGQNAHNQKNQFGQDKTPAPAGQNLGKAEQARAEDTQQKQGEKSAIGGGTASGQAGTETKGQASSEQQAKATGEDAKGAAAKEPATGQDR